MKIAPVLLSGRHVRLEPLTPAHIEPMFAAASDPELWRWTHALNQRSRAAILRMGR